MLCDALIRLVSTSAKISVIIFGLLCFFNFLPKSVKFTAFEVTEPRSMVGPLNLNKLLNGAERLFEGQIKGPEGFAILNGELYTSLQGGYIAKIKNGKIENVVKFGEPCSEISEHWWDERKCGRPLGLAATKDDHLLAADAYYGIWKYNPKTKQSINLVPHYKPIDGIVPKIFNDVASAKDGTVYWSHSSADYDICEGVFVMLADPSGRLLKYDPVTKENTVLLDKLYFANGVALSEDESYVLVAETGRAAIRRVYLKGPKKGSSDIFIDGLPGMPDGIRPTGKRGFFITLNVPRDAGTPVVTDSLAPLPYIRQIISRALSGIKLFAQQLYNLYPCNQGLKIIQMIGHFEMLVPFLPTRATVLEVDENGKVLQSYHSLDGPVRSLSDVEIYQGYLYLGSPYNTYLGRVKLSDINFQPKK